MKTMYIPSFKCLLAIAAIAVSTDAVADTPAAISAAGGQAPLGNTTGESHEQAANIPHARMLGAVHGQGNIYRQLPQIEGGNAELIGTLAECLALADGWLQQADLSRIHILRAANAEQNIPPTVINFREYLVEGKPEHNVPIYAGDTIYVPEVSNTAPLTVQNIRRIEQTYYSSYSSNRTSVYVINNTHVRGNRPTSPHHWSPRPRPVQHLRPSAQERTNPHNSATNEITYMIPAADNTDWRNQQGSNSDASGPRQQRRSSHTEARRPRPGTESSNWRNEAKANEEAAEVQRRAQHQREENQRRARPVDGASRSKLSDAMRRAGRSTN